MARVVIENLSRTFKGRKGETVHAVRQASLVVEDGEFVVLVGPSGCGKSTTLRLIAGLEEASAGTISIDGRVVNGVDPKDRDIAMVFQNYALYPHMTVYENMAFGLKLRKLPRPEIERRVGEVAATLGLTACLDRLPKALSGGQRQRVAVGRAIVRQPKVFLFDEPLSNLDAQMRVQMRAELSRLHARLRATMIYVTHDQVEAMTLGDRIVVMNDGVVQQVADPLTLYHRPANQFVAGFIGSPPMNFLRGQVQRQDDGLYFQEQNPGVSVSRLRVPDGAVQTLGPRVGQEIILGVRPEDVSMARDASAANSIAGVVEVVEPMGAETHLYFNTGAHSGVARVPPDAGAVVNQKLTFAFAMHKARFFDVATGQSLTS